MLAAALAAHARLRRGGTTLQKSSGGINRRLGFLRTSPRPFGLTGASVVAEMEDVALAESCVPK